MKLFLDSIPDMTVLREKLHEPANKYRVFPIRHDLCDPDGDIAEKLDEILHGEAGGVVTNVTWKDPRWMSEPANTARLKDAALLAEKRDLRVWMYDDYAYPSGLANGYAIKDHPEYMPDSIDFLAFPCRAGESVTLIPPEPCGGVLAVAVCDAQLNKLEDLPLAGPVTPKNDGTIFLFYIHPHREDGEKPLGHAAGTLHHLRADAIDSFILHALEPVERNVGLARFDAVFTDEPTLVHHVRYQEYTIDFNCVPAPYAPELFSRYEAEWGEDLKDRLMDILAGESRRARLTRVRYYDTVSRLARDVFIDRVTAYLHAHGTLSSGHFLLEESLFYHVGFYADFMRVMGGQDIPGCDVLCGVPEKFWEERSGFGTASSLAGKYPSSISRLNGHNVTMLEMCPFLFKDEFLKKPFPAYMGLSTFAIFSGTTHFNAYGYQYLNDEQRTVLNRCVGRMQTILRNAAPDAPVAVYYPISQMQSWFVPSVPAHDTRMTFLPQVPELEHDMETLSRTLYALHTDFHFIDTDHLLSADLSDGLSCGLVHAKTLLVPFCDFLSVPEALALKAFEANGGRLFFIRRVPRFDPHGDDDSLREALSGLCAPCLKLEDLPAHAKELTPDMPFTLSGTFFASPHTLAGRKFLFVINPTEEERTIAVTGACEVYFPETDVWKDEPAAFALPAGRGAFVFEKQ